MKEGYTAIERRNSTRSSWRDTHKKESEYMNKACKKPQGVKGVQVKRYNLGVNKDDKIRLKPMYRVRQA